jgi:hypothetical protein
MALLSHDLLDRISFDCHTFDMAALFVCVEKGHPEIATVQLSELQGVSPDWGSSTARCVAAQRDEIKISHRYFIGTQKGGSFGAPCLEQPLGT